MNSTADSTADWMFVNGEDTTPTHTPHTKAPALLFKVLQVVIIIVIFIGLPGNLLTIISVCHYRRLRTAGNAFVTCMSIGDSLYYSFMLPIRFATYQYDGQFFSDQFCVFLGSFSHFVQAISVMSLSAISLNRLLFILQHKHYQKMYSRGALIIQLSFIWGFALFFTILLPCSGLWGDFSFQEHVLACTFTPGSDPGYMITVVTCGFWVPTTFIVVCYSMIYVHFMSSHNKVNSWTKDQRKMTTVNPEPEVKPALSIKSTNKLTKIQEEEQTSHLRAYMNRKVSIHGTRSGAFNNGLSISSHTTSTNSSAAPTAKGQDHWHGPRHGERRGSQFSTNSGQCLIAELSSQEENSGDQDIDSTKTGQSGGNSDTTINSVLQRKSSEVLSKSAVSVTILSPGNDTGDRQFYLPSQLTVRESQRHDSISSISELLEHEESVNRLNNNEIGFGITNNGITNKGKASELQGKNRKEICRLSKDESSTFQSETNAAVTTVKQAKNKNPLNASRVAGDSADKFYMKVGQNTFVTEKSTGKGSNNNNSSIPTNTVQELLESQPTQISSRDSVSAKPLHRDNDQRRLSASELLHLTTEVLMHKRKQLAHKEHHQNLNQTIANKRRKEAIRMTLMMLCIFCLFVICILPYFLVNIVNSEIENASAYLIALMCTWFNGCVNPVVYAMMNAQFRAAYKSLVSRCPRSGPCGSRDKVKGRQNSDKVRLQLNQSATHI